MGVRVLLNRKGLTLVEVMIALVVLLFVSLAMMQTALVSIDSNMKNTIRTEAVSMAEKIINDMRSLAFSSAGLTDTGGAWVCVDLPPPAAPCTGSYSTETRAVRSAAVDFQRQKMITNRGSENKELYVRVRWTWKGEPYDYTVSTVLRR